MGLGSASAVAAMKAVKKISARVLSCGVMIMKEHVWLYAKVERAKVGLL